MHRVCSITNVEKKPIQSTTINILTFAYILPLQAQTVLYNKTFCFRLQTVQTTQVLCSCTGNQMIEYFKFRSCAQLISD